MENPQVIYLLRADSDEKGESEIEGLRFRIYEEVAPEYEPIYRETRIKEQLLEAISIHVRAGINAGKTHFHYEHVITLDDI